MGRHLIFGDLHGSYRALMQCLEKASFNPDEDTLYSTGDIADGYPDVYASLGFLMGLRDFHPVIGNHDVWLQIWLVTGKAPRIWTSQGGRVSIESFAKGKASDRQKLRIAEWMASWPYVELSGSGFIMHGGPGVLMNEQEAAVYSKKKRNLIEPSPGNDVPTPHRIEDSIMWDRLFFGLAKEDEMAGKRMDIGRWEENRWLFIGHTEFGDTSPFISRLHSMVNLDTMAGSYGCLTLMDMDTKEYWQSDLSSELYPGYGPRYWRSI